MLETERLILKLLEEQDEHDIVEWRNRQDVVSNFFSSKGITISEHRNWYANYVKDHTRLEFVIRKKENDKNIGSIGLNYIDYKNQKAEYGILIGDPEERGKGYAKEASIALIQYAFYELNLHKVKLHVFKENLTAINLYEMLGFKEEGILQREVYKNGTFKDVIAMAVFREDWVNHG